MLISDPHDVAGHPLDDLTAIALAEAAPDMLAVLQAATTPLLPGHTDHIDHTAPVHRIIFHEGSLSLSTVTSVT
jgi:hypothetical protein